jgi:hypothetical protein
MPGRFTKIALALALTLPVAACESLGLGDDKDVSVSFAVAENGMAGQASLVAADSFTDGVHVLNLTTVSVLFDEITLERDEDEVGGDSDGDSEADSDSDGSSNEKVRRGPFTVNLPVAGGVITPINEALPAGRYEEVELDVGSVRVVGTFDGQPFDVTVPVQTELDLEFDSPFVVDDDADRLNVTIAIDFSRWFRDSSGVLLSPQSIATNSSLRAQVIDRIRNSFRAFEDSDRDADDADSDSDSDHR